MRSTLAFVAAAAAPLASATLQTCTTGGAKIINYCSQEVPMKNIPAMGPSSIENGVEEDKNLAANGKGDNQYFNDWAHPMQFEYTWTGDNQIWYDMSLVDGNNTDGSPITYPSFGFSTGSGALKTNAYAYSTDDKKGMQIPVGLSTTVTLLLCPESSSAAAAAPTAATTTTAAAATTTTTTTTAAPTTTSVAPAYTPSSTTTTTLATSAINKNAVSSTPAVLATPTSSATSSDDVEIVTKYEYETAIVTAVVTETAHAKARRHEHRHPHGHKH
ncbi:hypothetical protein K461DRAFT_122134 [Myriangium duriaei CBS 260.36]|uniref:Uncharacterized protein n=1 Tax=Myriangium duriaei CBS 260.36 TaxID=1168546 RepID=A0A9P4J4S6_9PEZI|nr:hypothetical protein K461DRAFT_122134 [Myriangium duriaei CBS 260.36]